SPPTTSRLAATSRTPPTSRLRRRCSRTCCSCTRGRAAHSRLSTAGRCAWSRRSSTPGPPPRGASASASSPLLRTAYRGMLATAAGGRSGTGRLLEGGVHPNRSARMKTTAARILESVGIRYELRTYEVGDEHSPAEVVAQKVGLPPEQVWKTLVVRGDRQGVCFAVVPANASLDLKALAKLSGDRKVDTVPLKEVTPLTGYVRGGVTALGAKKDC